MKKIHYIITLVLLNICASFSASAAVTYVHTDHLGSVVAESNASGQITKRFHYKPFGETIETQQDDIGYTGHKHDADLGLTYMQARYYDPIGYLGKNPYKYTDPTGMTCVTNQDQVACTIDLVNIGTRDKPNYVGRDEGISSGKVTETQLQKLEGNITKAYAAAQKLGDNTVTIKGASDVKDISVTGNQIASALGDATLRVDNNRKAGTSANASTDYLSQTVTFNNKAIRFSNYPQMRTTVHESMHLLNETSEWNDNSKYRFLHQDPFGNAADEVLKGSGYEK